MRLKTVVIPVTAPADSLSVQKLVPVTLPAAPWEGEEKCTRPHFPLAITAK